MSLTTDGVTPLHDTNSHCAVLLLAAGANVCARDSSGQTALHCVVRMERFDRRAFVVSQLVLI
jgi:ankyrin repeat protein